MYPCRASSWRAKYYNYFRDYDPAIGRYIESDPIGLVGGFNTFGYVGGNPLTFIDPRGLQSIAACANPANAAVCAEAGISLGPIFFDYPDRPRTKGRVRCNCKCFANTEAGGECGKSEEGFGEGESHADAQRAAEREAKKKLGCQAEHCQCKCVNSKGDRSATGGR